MGHQEVYLLFFNNKKGLGLFGLHVCQAYNQLYKSFFSPFLNKQILSVYDPELKETPASLQENIFI